MIIDYIGYIGTTLLSSAGIFQLIKSMKDGHVIGVSYWYLLFIWFGLIAMDTFVIVKNPSMQLIISYTIQFIIFTSILYRKLFPKEPMLH